LTRRDAPSRPAAGLVRPLPASSGLLSRVITAPRFFTPDARGARLAALVFPDPRPQTLAGGTFMVRRLVGPVALLSLASLALGGAGVAFSSCASDDNSGTSGDCSSTGTSTAASAPANEWVNFHVEVPLAAGDFDPLASGLFGAAAQAGKFIDQKVLSPGMFVSSSAETQTPTQTRLTFSFDDGTNPNRVMAVAPASFATGGVFISTVDVAMSTMTAEEAAQPGSSESWLLEYRVSSAMGGKLSFGVRGVLGVYTLVVDVTSPHTGLTAAEIGKPIDTFSPYDTVAGTVNFHLSKDDFDFFVTTAYGAGATSKQNFSDFQLVPHNWLRLTVGPHLAQQFVDVSFDVVTLGGTRVHVANAPASILAGGTFQALVDRNMSTMLTQEAAKVGSSTPWTVPFYYNDPSGGGVVQVIAQGALGVFQIAYSIESPQNALKDVPFVAYEPVTIVVPDASASASCASGSDPSVMLAPAGTFDITFSASSTILTSPSLKGPLQGTIYCSVFHSSDVNVGGPLPGAVSLQDFTIPNANLSAPPAPTFTTKTLYAGDYQILCFQDLAGTTMVAMGDPVTLPIGSFTMACNKNPVNVEFAILDPQ
jgi:hypothetical protein